MAHKIKRGAAVLGASALVASAFGAQPAAASGTAPAQRFEHLAGLIGKTFQPAVTDTTSRVSVILQLSGDSVGERVAAAKEAGREVASSERAAVRAQVERAQRGVEAAVRAGGGEVVASYQDVYNGVAVHVSPAQLRQLQQRPDVVAVHQVGITHLDNVAGVQFIGGNQAWAGPAKTTGKGVKIAILDTGTDYTHADFGGPGTKKAYENNDPTKIEKGTFPTAKVIGGWDFVGNAYDAGDPAHDVPEPDPDPLDCEGHGSHVAGTAAGFGVLANGHTYNGPYNASTYNHDFTVGPGVAPQAEILSYKVFGCAGSVEDSIIVAALDRALRDGADVVNMSLGSPFGGAQSPETVAVNTLSRAGVVVVASAGNNGQNAYVEGAPASANRAISVAAIDASRAFLPGAHAVFSTGDSTDLQDSNEADFAEGLKLPVKVLHNADGTISLGCDPKEYAGTKGMLVVTQRGTCARVARAIFGQKAGAAAVVMINSDSAYPPMEGQITMNPDTGENYTVTIPFFGATGTPATFQAFEAADGGTVTLTHTQITNPGYKDLASFTSGGPRVGDSALKPDITAPGVSVISVDRGSGNGATTMSGTSMASPMTAGAAALVTQAHPNWATDRIKAALMNTAEAGPSKMQSWDPRVAGAGVVQVQRAVDTTGVILAGAGQSTLSFGYDAIKGAYRETKTMTIVNTGSKATTYRIAGSFAGDALGARLSVSPSLVSVPAGKSVTVDVTLSLGRPAVAALPDADASNFGTLATIRGAVVATPTTSGAGRYDLRVPFLLVPHGLSDVVTGSTTKPKPKGTDTFVTSVRVANHGVHKGTADVYAWGLADPEDTDDPSVDVRVAGVQVLPGAALGGDASDRSLVFAVNTYGAWSNAATEEVDVPIDLDRDGEFDGFVVGIDLGLVTTGEYDGRFAALTVDSDGTIVDAWIATAPMNTSTMELPALASELGIGKHAPDRAFRYGVATTSAVNGLGDSTGLATFDAFEPAVSSGAFATLAPGAGTVLPLSYRASAVHKTDPLGWLVVSLDDANGAAQADTVPVPGR